MATNKHSNSEERGATAAKKFPTLKEFLSEAGVNKYTPIDKVAQLKKDYRKFYLRYYEQHKRKKQNRIEIRFSKEEYRLLQQAAQDHYHKHLSPFIKESALAYVQQRIVMPKIDEMESLTASITKIGHLINQLVQRTHGLKLYAQENQYIALKARVGDLEQLVQEEIACPKLITAQTLMEYIQAFLQDAPHYKDYLIEWIAEQEFTSNEEEIKEAKIAENSVSISAFNSTTKPPLK